MVPIIVMSGDDGEPSKVEALDSGADDYIVKPVGHSELMARVRAALRRTAPARGDAVVEVGDFRVEFDVRPNRQHAYGPTFALFAGGG
jgi:two-component system KDP operon response regulator KdpE